MSRHAYSVDEANALIPHVRATFEQIRQLAESAEQYAGRLRILDVMWGEAVLDPDNPDHADFSGTKSRFDELRERAEDLVRTGLIDRDIRLPSGALEHGLVDFPTTLDGRWIYLCWQYDESEIGFWHEIQGGYAGRQEITADERARMADPDDPIREDDSTLDF